MSKPAKPVQKNAEACDISFCEDELKSQAHPVARSSQLSEPGNGSVPARRQHDTQSATSLICSVSWNTCKSARKTTIHKAPSFPSRAFPEFHSPIFVCFLQNSEAFFWISSIITISPFSVLSNSNTRSSHRRPSSPLISLLSGKSAVFQGFDNIWRSFAPQN